METPKQHPHAELIKAWADGAKIQMFNFRDKKWEDQDSPTWLGDKYRVKPEKSNEHPPVDTIDGKPLTALVKEVIRKFRAGVPFPEAEVGTWRALSPGEDALVRAMRKAFDKHFLVITKRNNDLSCHSCCIASPHDIDEEIRNAIKRIQKEQEG